MKHILLLAGTFIFLGACTQQADHSQENLQLIENYIKAVEAVDIHAMDNLLAENYLGLGPSYGDSIGKDAAIANWQNNVENLYSGIKYNRSRVIPVKITSGENQGEWVSNWAELEISYKDDRGSVTIWANSIYKIENDKIVESITFYNEADALRQLGYVFLHPNDL
jgi:opacity protein-like surface antigen